MDSKNESDAPQTAIIPGESLNVFNGLVLVSLDETLTLLDANADFFKILDESRESFASRGNSVRAILGPHLEKQLSGLLHNPDIKPVEPICGYLLRQNGLRRNVQVTLCPFSHHEKNGQNASWCRLSILDLTGLDSLRFRRDAANWMYGNLLNDSALIPFEYHFGTDVIRFSQIYQDIFGTEPMIYGFCERLRKGEHIDTLTDAFRSFFLNLKKGDDGNFQEHLIQTCSHDERWFSIRCNLVENRDGKVHLAQGIVEDIDRFKRHQLNLIEKTKLDTMTGLYNKAAIEESVRQAALLAHPDAMGILLVIDVDNFKLVNDSMGHMAGDSVLKQIAMRLRSIFRNQDIVGRSGGDEFHVYMRDVPNITVLHERAQTVCDDIRTFFETSNLPVPVSMSVGISIASEPMTFDELYRQADVALYHAKSLGKNRYEIFGQLTSNRSAKASTGETVQPETVPESRQMTAPRDSLMTDVLDILFASRDAFGQVDETLEYIGNSLGIDRVVIFEKSTDLKRISITHEWANSPERYFKDRYQNAQVEKDVFFPPVDERGLFYCADTRLLTDPKSHIVKDMGLTSYVQCGMMDGRQIIGYICFESHSGLHIWSQTEVDTLLLMSRVLGESISLKQSSIRLERSYRMTNDILNNLAGKSVCVIDSGSREILYFNHAFEQLVPDVKIGERCHDRLWHCDHPCDFCPVNPKERKTVQLTLSGMAMKNVPDNMLDVTYTPFLWKGEKPAYVLIFSEHMISATEKEQREKLVSFARAFASVSDFLVDVDLETGMYQILQENQLWPEKTGHAGKYDDFEQHMLSWAMPVYHKAIRDSFSLERLRQFVSDGSEGEIEEEYQLNNPCGETWYQNRAYPYRYANGSTHMLVMATNITARKIRQQKQMHDREISLLAIRSFFDEIFRVHLESGRVEAFYIGHDIQHYDIARPYREIVKERVFLNVLPEDTRGLLHFLDTDVIQKKLLSNEVLEYNYRTHSGDQICWKQIAIHPINDEETLFMMRDITALKQAEIRHQEREQDYLSALCHGYNEIYELDLEADRVTSLGTEVNLLQLNSLSGNYWKDTVYLAEHLIPEEDRDAFLNFCRPETIQAACGGDRSHYTEYRMRLTKQHDYRWCNSLIMPMTKKGKYLFLSRDIHDRKMEEIRQHDLEKSYLLALRNSYAEIHELDLRNDNMNDVFGKGHHYDVFDIRYDRFHEATQILADKMVYPEDRPIFLAQYNENNIRQTCLGEQKKLYAEYRTIMDGEIKWFSSKIIPFVPEEDRYLILIHDIQQRKQQDLRRMQKEHTYLKALQSSYSEVWKVNLKKNEISNLYSMSALGQHLQTLLSLSTSYRTNTAKIARHLVYNPDRKSFLYHFNPENIAALRHGKHTSSYVEYRLVLNGEIRWYSSTITPVSGMDDTYLFLTQDIESRKQTEMQRNDLEKNYLLALRKIYLEILEINLQDDTPVVLYADNDKLVPVDLHPNTDINTVAKDTIHPDDKKVFMDMLGGKHLMACFNDEKQTQVTTQYRRLGHDGNYCWVEVTALPLLEAGSGQIVKALLLIRDMSEAHEQEMRQRIAERYDTALRSIYDYLFIINYTDNTCRLISQNLPPLYYREGISLNSYITLLSEQLIHPEEREPYARYFSPENIHTRFADGREYDQIEYMYLRPDGIECWYQLMLIPLKSQQSSDDDYLLFVMNIDERKQAEELLRKNAILEQQRDAEGRYRIIAEQTGTMVFEWNNNGQNGYCSPELKDLFDGAYRDGQSILTCWLEDGVVHEKDHAQFDAFLRDISNCLPHAEALLRLRKRTGNYIWCKLTSTCLFNKDNEPYRYVGTINDVEEATQSMLSLRYRAEYDTLTGLFNMPTFYARAGAMLNEHPVGSCYIIRLDIDRFKVINDMYGMEGGDSLLRFIAELLNRYCSHDAVIARFSNDIFYACLAWSRTAVLDMIQKVTGELASYPVGTHIWPSFGLCLVDNRTTPVNVLCDCALLAQKTIKGNSIAAYAFYDDQLHERIMEEKQIENDMQNALERGEFVLYFQPKVKISTGRIVGCEALVRWKHPEKGIIPPDKFIPLFEKNGFINRLDEHVWEQACHFIRNWLDQGLNPIPVAINVSRVHACNPLFANKLETLVGKYAIPHALLEVELTESAFLKNEVNLFDVVNRLRRHGFTVAMDDFGSGYSSLNMLKDIPIDVIKLDKAFLSESEVTERSRNVVHYSIILAEKMNVKVVAEGVETKEQADFLLNLGCDCAQGYYYSAPVSEEAFYAMFVSERPLGNPAEKSEKPEKPEA